MPFDFVHILYGFDLQIYNKTIALHVLQQKNPPQFRKMLSLCFSCSKILIKRAGVFSSCLLELQIHIINIKRIVKLPIFRKKTIRPTMKFI